MVTKKQFIELTDSWIDVQQKLFQFLTNSEKDEQTLVIEKFNHAVKGTDGVLMDYFTQEIPLGIELADNFEEIIEGMLTVYWQFVQGSEVCYYYETEDGREETIITDSDTLYECMEVTKQLLW